MCELQVLTQLHSSSLPEDQLGLLRPLHQRGAKETKKQRLRRALKLQRAGLTDFEGAQELLQPRKVRGVGAAAGSSSSSEDGSGESESEDADQQQQSSAAAAAVAGVAETADASDTDEELERPAKQAKLSAGIVGQQQQLDPAAAAAQQQAQLAALRAEAKALKAQAKAEAAAEGAGEFRVKHICVSPGMHLLAASGMCKWSRHEW